MTIGRDNDQRVTQTINTHMMTRGWATGKDTADNNQGRHDKGSKIKKEFTKHGITDRQKLDNAWQHWTSMIIETRDRIKTNLTESRNQIGKTKVV